MSKSELPAENQSSNYFQDFLSRIDKIYLKLYIALMAVGILCHGFMLFNKIPNHDDVVALADKGTSYRLGRWFLDATGIISGPYSIPLFIGVFSITMMIFSAFLVCRVLDITQPGRIFAVGAVMVCFPAAAGTFAFMFTADSYFLALYFACMGVWLIVKSPVKFKNRTAVLGGVFNYAFAVILFALTLGIYQAYFSAAVTLAVLYGMKLFLNCRFVSFMREFIKIIAALTAGMLLYLILNHFILIVTDTSFTETSISNVLAVFPHALFMSYKNVLALVCSDLAGLSYGRLIQAGWLLAMAAGCLIFAGLVLKKRKNIFFALLFIAVLPISVNFMRFFMNGREMDALIMYAYVFLLIMPVSLLGELEKTVIKNASWSRTMKKIRTVYAAAVFVIVWQYVIQINRFYVGMEIMETEAISYYTTLITQIKSVEDYSSEMQVCLLGSPSRDRTMARHYPFNADIRGKLTLADFLSMYSREAFMSLYCGFSPWWHSNSGELSQLPEVQEMPCYPEDGSIRIINGIVVVKMD